MKGPRYSDERASLLDLRQETVEPVIVGTTDDYLRRLMTGDYPFNLLIWAIWAIRGPSSLTILVRWMRLLSWLRPSIAVGRRRRDRWSVQARELNPSVSRRACRVRPRERTTPDAFTPDHQRLRLDR